MTLSWVINRILYSLLLGMENKRWELTYQQYRKKYNISPSFRFNGKDILLYGEGEIILGENSYIGRNSSIQSSKGYQVLVGKNCAISHFFMVYTENRIPQTFSDSQEIRKGSVEIGDYCWIGAYVFIREGVKIGDNAVIGVHSVVTHNIPSNSVAVGSPARVIKKIPE